MRWLPSLAMLIACAAWGADKKDMPPNEPMHTKMKKPGMKTGDVKKSAEKNRRRVDPTLKKESRSMESGKGR